MSGPKYLLVADTHLREDCPECRIDDYQSEQWRKLEFIIQTAKDEGVDAILHAGDLVHKASDQTRSTFIGNIIRILRCDIPIILCPGNHDCPNHREDRLRRGKIGGLFDGLPNLVLEIPHGIEMLHSYVWHPDNRPSLKIPGRSANEVLKMTKAPLVVTGDNHQSFVFEMGGRLLVNPGSMMRMTADQSSFKPKIYLWDSAELKTIRIPIVRNVVSREHIEDDPKIDDQMEVYVKRMVDAERIALNFRENLKTYLAENKESKEVSHLIWEAVDGDEQ